MDTLERADAFFFITSIAVIVGTIAWIVIAYFLVSTLSWVRKLVEKLENDVDEAGDEVREMLDDIRSSALFRFFFRRRRSNKDKQYGED